MQKKNNEPSTWTLYVDGASRNNPGPAGAGIFLLKDNQAVSREGFYLGIKTNNQAEYLALLLGLFFLHKYAQPNDVIKIASDSLLLVKQLNGEYKVKHPFLQPLHILAKKLLQPLRVDIFHVMREDNVEADKLANKGVDTKKEVPAAFVQLLQNHEISME